jgi:uncharacterized protein (DUF58 family)
VAARRGARGSPDRLLAAAMATMKEHRCASYALGSWAGSTLLTPGSQARPYRRWAAHRRIESISCKIRRDVPAWFNLRPEEELGSAVAAKELTGDGRVESDSSRGRSP